MLLILYIRFKDLLFDLCKQSVSAARVMLNCINENEEINFENLTQEDSEVVKSLFSKAETSSSSVNQGIIFISQVRKIAVFTTSNLISSKSILLLFFKRFSWLLADFL